MGGKKVKKEEELVGGMRRMLIRCRPRRRHQKELASGLVTSHESVSPPASPLFECAIVRGIRDDDERNFFFLLRHRRSCGTWFAAERRGMIGEIRIRALSSIGFLGPRESSRGTRRHSECRTICFGEPRRARS